jgi:putative transposase
MRSHSPKDRHEALRVVLREEFHNAHGRYGYRRLRLVLAQQHGIHASGKTIVKLLREENLKCLVRRKKYRSYKGEIGETAPNLLNRQFKAAEPNQKWVTDVTEFRIGDKKHYLSPLIDLFNGEVLSYTVSTTPNLALVNEMLKQALTKLPAGVRPLIHSDQGWQYQHLSYRAMITEAGLTQSMSRKGNCLDNAVAENFFGHFKEELLRLKPYESYDKFEPDLHEYIRWYNQERIQLKLNGLSPVNFRTQPVGLSFKSTP